MAQNDKTLKLEAPAVESADNADDFRVNKARFWNVIFYPENLKYDTLEDAADDLGIPYAYCVHDKDKDGHDGDRKTHIHVLLAFANSTTFNHVYKICLSMSKNGRKCCLPPEASKNVRHSYDYLIHDTDNARKKKKHQYQVDERICCNNFDIGLYEQVSQAEKDAMAKELCDFAYMFGFEHMAGFYGAFERADQFRENHAAYFAVLKTVNAMVDRICRGNQYEAKRKRMEAKPPKCSWCGSNKVIGKVDTKDGYLWFCSECQETAYVVLSEVEKDREESEERR